MAGIARLVFGIGFSSIWLGLGLYILFNPYKSAKFFAQLRSVGTEIPWEDVEPERWFIMLTRFIGLYFTFIGLYIIYLAI